MKTAVLQMNLKLEWFFFIVGRLWKGQIECEADIRWTDVQVCVPWWMGTLGERMALHLPALSRQQISLDAPHLQNLVKLNTFLIPWGQLLLLFSQSATMHHLQVETDARKERKEWENFKRLGVLCGEIPVIPPKQKLKGKHKKKKRKSRVEMWQPGFSRSLTVLSQQKWAGDTDRWSTIQTWGPTSLKKPAALRGRASY